MKSDPNSPALSEPLVDTGPKGLDLANLGGIKPDQEIVEAAVRAAKEAMRNK